MSDMFGITVLEQIECARREVAMRKRVYPRWVANGKMKQNKADLEIEIMESIVDLLLGLQKTGFYSQKGENNGG